MRESARSLLPECDIDSNAIAGFFVAIFEGELGDAGFVELAEAFGDHDKSATGRIHRGEPGATPKAFGAEGAIHFRHPFDPPR